MLSSCKLKQGERKELGLGNWKEWSKDLWSRVGVCACVR